MTSQSTKVAIENDPRWAAVVARDPQADGQFVYAVENHRNLLQPQQPGSTAKTAECRIL